MADDTSETDDEAPDAPDASEEAKETAHRGEIPDSVRQALSKANKEAATLRRKLKEFEDRDKSDLERFAERAEKAEKRALDADRYQVALSKGLTLTQAKRLVGANLDEFEADAAELLADLGVKPTNKDETSTTTDEVDGEKPTPATKPREDLTSGSGSTDVAAADDIDDVKAIGARMFGR